MTTTKKLNWKNIVHKVILQKERIEAHIDKGLPLSDLKDVKFIKPLFLPDNN